MCVFCVCVRVRVRMYVSPNPDTRDPEPCTLNRSARRWASSSSPSLQYTIYIIHRASHHIYRDLSNIDRALHVRSARHWASSSSLGATRRSHSFKINVGTFIINVGKMIRNGGTLIELCISDLHVAGLQARVREQQGARGLAR